MTIGQLIDSVILATGRRGLEMKGIHWTHSDAFDNLRISARRQGTTGPGRTAVLTNHECGNWSRSDVDDALTQLEKLFKSSRD